MDAARLEKLLDGYLDEALTSEQKTELEQMLRGDAQARQIFWQHARFHALLRESGAENRGREMAAEPARPWWAGWREMIELARHNAGWATALAAVVMLAMGVWLVRTQTEASRDRMTTGVAVLTQAIDLEWAPGSESHGAGAALSPGWLRMKSGLAQIEFSDGARLIVEGPAELQIVSRSEAFCRAGRLSVQVPPAARGFKISSPQMSVIDLGTSFGFEAREGGSEVHVFEGKVELAASATLPQRELVAGQGMGVDAGGARRELTASSNIFPSTAGLEKKAISVWGRRTGEWREAMQTWRADPALLLLATFDAESPFERRLRNAATSEKRATDGAIVGCRWAEGRWPGKQALEFKGIGDRVRLDLPGPHDTLTLAAWVRVDGLDHNFSSLLMADGYERGEIHWQITKAGAVRLGLNGVGDTDTPIIFRPERLGQWVHLAVSIDRVGGHLRHYLDGQEMTARDFKLRESLTFGSAEIGNWNPTTRRDQTPIRNFNGRMDEMLVFSRILTAQEIRSLAHNGPSPQFALQ